MSTLRLSLVSGFAVAMLAGCSGSDTLPGAGAGDTFGGGGFDSGSEFSTSGEGGGGRIGEFDQGGALPQELLSNLVVYFEFDRSEIRSEFNDMLAAHGRGASAPAGDGSGVCS